MMKRLGVCPVCVYGHPLAGDGTLRAHATFVGRQADQPCAGSGMAPFTVVDVPQEDRLPVPLPRLD